MSYRDQSDSRGRGGRGGQFRGRGGYRGAHKQGFNDADRSFDQSGRFRGRNAPRQNQLGANEQRLKAFPEVPQHRQTANQWEESDEGEDIDMRTDDYSHRSSGSERYHQRPAQSGPNVPNRQYAEYNNHRDHNRSYHGGSFNGRRERRVDEYSSRHPERPSSEFSRRHHSQDSQNDIDQEFSRHSINGSFTRENSNSRRGDIHYRDCEYGESTGSHEFRRDRHAEESSRSSFNNAPRSYLNESHEYSRRDIPIRSGQLMFVNSNRRGDIQQQRVSREHRPERHEVREHDQYGSGSGYSERHPKRNPWEDVDDPSDSQQSDVPSSENNHTIRSFFRANDVPNHPYRNMIYNHALDRRFQDVDDFRLRQIPERMSGSPFVREMGYEEQVPSTSRSSRDNVEMPSPGGSAIRGDRSSGGARPRSNLNLSAELSNVSLHDQGRKVVSSSGSEPSSRGKKKHKRNKKPHPSNSTQSIDKSIREEANKSADVLVDLPNQLPNNGIQAAVGSSNSVGNMTFDGALPSDGPSNQLPSQSSTSNGPSSVFTNDVELPTNVLAPKLAPANRNGFKKETLVTNHFVLELNPIQEIFRYDVDVIMVVSTEKDRKEVNMAKGPRDDAAITNRHELVRAALRKALEMYRILTEHGALVYDDAAMMFTNENLAAALKPHNSTLSVPVDALDAEIRSLIFSNNATEFIIQIHPCREQAAHFTLGEAQNLVNGGSTDRPLRHFLELLTNQEAVNKHTYVCYGAGKVFLNDKTAERPVGRSRIPDSGQVYKHGASKGIRFIQGRPSEQQKSPLVAALLLDAKLGTFYKADNLVNIFCELNHWRDPAHAVWTEEVIINSMNFINKVRLQFTHRRGDFFADAITDMPLESLFEEDIQLNSRYPAIDKYVDQKVKYRKWPAVMQKTPRGVVFHSMEFLQIAEHQRVPMNKQHSDPPVADKPSVRWRNILQHMSALNLIDGTNNHNSLLNRFGVCINPNPMRIEGFRRPAPKIMYKNMPVQVDTERSNWKTRNTKFEIGGKIDLLLFTWDKIPSKQLQDMERVCNNIVNEARNKGMRIEEVYTCTVNLEYEVANQKSEKSIFYKAQKEADKGRKVMIIYCDPPACKTHGMLKLLEVRVQVPTQHLTSEVAMKMVRPGATLEQFLMKLNCKMFGVNYVVVPDIYIKDKMMNQSLIIGLDVAHPTGQSAGQKSQEYAPEFPSVVGFSANCVSHPDMFVGDYAYQEPLREKIAARVLNVRLKWILSIWVKNRGELPHDIWIVRDGVSEGQYDMVLNEELPAIQEACDEFQHGYRPRFMLIITTKRHHKRFLKEKGTNGPYNNDPMENPKAGTVVDTDVVRPDMTEFFMQSHHALQGTSKFTAYNLLKSDMPELKQDTLQPFMQALCFEHQICTSPTSIPEPVYQADEWAKRGNDVFRAYKDAGFKVPREGGQDKNPRALIQWDIMTTRLSYKGKRLEASRVNA